MLMFIIANVLPVRSRADDRADPATIAATLTARNWRLAIPDDRQHPVADRRQLHGAIGDHPDSRTDPVPDREELGIDPVHLGIVLVVNMEIGMVTPPVGLNLFVASGITGCRVVGGARGVSLADGAARLPVVITYVPEISLYLPNPMFGTAAAP